MFLLAVLIFFEDIQVRRSLIYCRFLCYSESPVKVNQVKRRGFYTFLSHADIPLPLAPSVQIEVLIKRDCAVR